MAERESSRRGTSSADTPTVVCIRCGGSFQLEEMAVDRHRASGRKPYCKPCDSKRSLERYYRRRGPKPVLLCSECPRELQGRQRVVCSSTCRERRWRRLHPEAAAEKQRRKRARRRARGS